MHVWFGDSENTQPKGFYTRQSIMADTLFFLAQLMSNPK